MEKVGYLLVAFILAALVVWKLILPNYRKKKYFRATLWSLLALGFIAAGLQGPSSTSKSAASSSNNQSSSKSNSSKSESSSSSSKSSNSSSSSSKAKSDSSKTSSTKSSNANSSHSHKKSESINDKLMKSLAEDQGWANGTLDKDGNHVQNGEQFPQYNWATHIQKILWKDKGIEVYIYDADNLTKSQLTTVAKSAQSAAIAQLLTENKISDDESIHGVYTTIYSGNEVIGHSKVLSLKDFKWTN